MQAPFFAQARKWETLILPPHIKSGRRERFQPAFSLLSSFKMAMCIQWNTRQFSGICRRRDFPPLKKFLLQINHQGTCIDTSKDSRNKCCWLSADSLRHPPPPETCSQLPWRNTSRVSGVVTKTLPIQGWDQRAPQTISALSPRNSQAGSKSQTLLPSTLGCQGLRPVPFLVQHLEIFNWDST